MVAKTNWTAEDAAEATGGKIQSGWQVSGVTIDTRRLQPGEMFIALQGEQVDGHEHIFTALEKGASAAMAAYIPEGVTTDKLLLVDDCMEALVELGRVGRERAQAQIVGVTGSVGKTSAKEMLRIALEVHGETFASHGNFNNHIGTPINLANLPTHVSYAVMEMGMNHAGEIETLTQMVRPHVALITNVEGVHLEFFDSVEAIADAKSEIFTGLTPGGTAVLNADNVYFTRCKNNAQAAGVQHIISFGEQSGADFRLLEVKVSPKGTEVRAMAKGKELSYHLKASGVHWALSSLGVLACVDALGLDIVKSAQALTAFEELPGRGRITPLQLPDGGTAYLVDDSYNASPASIRAAFMRMAELGKGGAVSGRLLAALGEMRELGETGPESHAALAKDAKATGFEKLYVAWPLMKHLYDALPPEMQGEYRADEQGMTEILKAALQNGDMLLVKGSNGSRMHAVAKTLIAELSGAQNGGEKRIHAV